MDAVVEQVSAAPAPVSYSLWQLVRYMLGLGTYGFGGPVALLEGRLGWVLLTFLPGDGTLVNQWAAEMHGVEVGNEMCVNTLAAFAGSDQQAVVDGDFAT